MKIKLCFLAILLIFSDVFAKGSLDETLTICTPEIMEAAQSGQEVATSQKGAKKKALSSCEAERSKIDQTLVSQCTIVSCEEHFLKATCKWALNLTKIPVKPLYKSTEESIVVQENIPYAQETSNLQLLDDGNLAFVGADRKLYRVSQEGIDLPTDISSVVTDQSTIGSPFQMLNNGNLVVKAIGYFYHSVPGYLSMISPEGKKIWEMSVASVPDFDGKPEEQVISHTAYSDKAGFAVLTIALKTSDAFVYFFDSSARFQRKVPSGKINFVNAVGGIFPSFVSGEVIVLNSESHMLYRVRNTGEVESLTIPRPVSSNNGIMLKQVQWNPEAIYLALGSWDPMTEGLLVLKKNFTIEFLPFPNSNYNGLVGGPDYGNWGPYFSIGNNGQIHAVAYTGGNYDRPDAATTTFKFFDNKSQVSQYDVKGLLISSYQIAFLDKIYPVVNNFESFHLYGRGGLLFEKKYPINTSLPDWKNRVSNMVQLSPTSFAYLKPQFSSSNERGDVLLMKVDVSRDGCIYDYKHHESAAVH